jgi:hypothetical protein
MFLPYRSTAILKLMLLEGIEFLNFRKMKRMCVVSYNHLRHVRICNLRYQNTLPEALRNSDERR